MTWGQPNELLQPPSGAPRLRPTTGHVTRRSRLSGRIVKTAPRQRMNRLISRAVVFLAFVASAVASPAQRADANREKYEPLDVLVEALGIQAGAVVADVGAGDGYYTERLARVVGPTGRVVAVDINEKLLEQLRARLQEAALTNVDVILGTTDDPRLSIDSLDAVLIFNAYHEMPEHATMLRQIQQALKTRGRLVIVEPVHDSNRSLGRDQQVAKHEIAPDIVAAELQAAGFTIDISGRMFTTFTSTADPGGFWLVRGIR